MNHVIRLPMQCRAATVAAESFDEAANTIDVVWTTGATVRRRTYDWIEDRLSEFEEELVVSSAAVRLDRLNSGAPFLNTHGQYDLRDVLGSVVPGTARLENGRGIATIRLSRSLGDADIVEKIRDGVIRNVSVGYAVHAVEKRQRDGQIPLHRITDWEPMEISAVPIPADPGATIRARSAGRDVLFDCIVTRTGGSNESRRIRMEMLHLHHNLPR